MEDDNHQPRGGHIGPMIAIILIIALLIFGAVYYLNDQLHFVDPLQGMQSDTDEGNV